MGLREHKHGVSSAVWGHPSRTSAWQLPASSLRCAPASGSSSGPAFGAQLAN
jgi:hypothetical protein